MTEIQNIFEQLLVAINTVLKRTDSWTLQLNFFGRFEHKQGRIIFFSCAKVYVNKEEEKVETLQEKTTRRKKAVKTLQKRKKKQIEGMIFKLVNIPTLLEEEQEFHKKKTRKSKRLRRRSIARKSSVLQKTKKSKSVLRSNRTAILGQRGCLRSTRLKPLKLLKARMGLKQEEINKNMSEVKRQEEIKVVEEFSRTLARPAGIQGECLSVSGRIASNYTPLSRYLFIDYEKKRIMYLKLKDSPEKENKPKNNLKSFFLMRPKNLISKNPMHLHPTKEEIDEFHSLTLKRKKAIQMKHSNTLQSNSQLIVLDETNKVKLDILKKKVDNHSKMLKNYRDLIACRIPEKVVFPLSEKFLEDIFNRVNIDFRGAKLAVIENQVDLLVKEIKEDYLWNVKKAILDYILKDKKQRQRLKINVNSFETIREWGDTDTQCVIIQKDPLEVRQISENKAQRNSVIIKSEAKEVLNDRFSIISDGKMRKSTFSMLNKKNQENLNNFARRSLIASNMGPAGLPPKRNLKEIKNSSTSSNQKTNRLSVKFNSMKNYLHSFQTKNNIDKKVVALVHRENFKTKVEELSKKLTLFDKPMEEIQTIRNYFKYTFDRRDKIIKKEEFNLEYRHVKDLIEIPVQRFNLEWESFIERNLSRIRSFRNHVVQKWMEEVSNVYQTSILGKSHQAKCPSKTL